jgi:hypothetical protein
VPKLRLSRSPELGEGGAGDIANSSRDLANRSFLRRNGYIGHNEFARGESRSKREANETGSIGQSRAAPPRHDDG